MRSPFVIMLLSLGACGGAPLQMYEGAPRPHSETAIFELRTQNETSGYSASVGPPSVSFRACNNIRVPLLGPTQLAFAPGVQSCVAFCRVSYTSPTGQYSYADGPNQNISFTAKAGHRYNFAASTNATGSQCTFRIVENAP